MRRFIRLPKSRNGTFNSIQRIGSKKINLAAIWCLFFSLFQNFLPPSKFGNYARRNYYFFVSIRYLLRESIELISLLKFSPNSAMRVTEIRNRWITARCVTNTHVQIRTREIWKKTPIYKIRMTQLRVATKSFAFPILSVTMDKEGENFESSRLLAFCNSLLRNENGPIRPRR